MFGNAAVLMFFANHTGFHTFPVWWIVVASLIHGYNVVMDDRARGRAYDHLRSLEKLLSDIRYIKRNT